MGNDLGSEQFRQVRRPLDARCGESYEIFRRDALQEKYDVARLPYALKVLLENLLRNGEDDGAEAVAKWGAKDGAVAGDRADRLVRAC